jgi:hypothetical protein
MVDCYLWAVKNEIYKVFCYLWAVSNMRYIRSFLNGPSKTRDVEGHLLSMGCQKHEIYEIYCYLWAVKNMRYIRSFVIYGVSKT